MKIRTPLRPRPEDHRNKDRTECVYILLVYSPGPNPGPVETL